MPPRRGFLPKVFPQGVVLFSLTLIRRTDRQAFGPGGPRRYSAFQFVAGNGYLPKDRDWAASPLSAGSPSLPYFVSSSMGGICDLITRGAPPPRTAPNAPEAPILSPPAHVPSDQEDAQATDAPSDYQSDWYANWSNSDWKRNRYRS